MCEDCGCEEGNAKAYFEHHHNHEHPHPHPHEHKHTDDNNNNNEIHIHVHTKGNKNIHVHIYEDAPHEHSHKEKHKHPHPHPHEHEHTHEHKNEEAPPREVILETNILAKNDKIAEQNRELLKQKGVIAINFISSPGSGKTFLLEKTLEGLKGRVKCAVIAGDQQTDNDAKRLENKGAKVIQIETGSSCHLNAEQVAETIDAVVEEDTQLLFIENVGNLVCPAAFDLGETIKIALLSVTEGEDKPLKYPVIFHDAATSVITKKDLLQHLNVDMDKYRDSLNKVHPKANIFELSALTGEGMNEWLDYLESLTKK